MAADWDFICLLIARLAELDGRRPFYLLVHQHTPGKRLEEHLGCKDVLLCNLRIHKSEIKIKQQCWNDDFKNTTFMLSLMLY